MEDFDKTDFVLTLASKTRHLIIEQAVLLEEILSVTIGQLLGINPKVSKSLGHSSESLGFNQKIRLMQDKIGIASDIKNKLEVFMHIRNKFAHVKSVNSFENYFKLHKGSLKDKKFLDKWYDKPDKIISNIEIKYRSI